MLIKISLTQKEIKRLKDHIEENFDKEGTLWDLEILEQQQVTFCKRNYPLRLIND